jgi:hypothetical protein
MLGHGDLLRTFEICVSEYWIAVKTPVVNNCNFEFL